MAQQVNNMTDGFLLFETFKTELSNVLKTLLDNQNSVKQELFLIRNNQAELTSSINKAKKTEPSSSKCQTQSQNGPPPAAGGAATGSPTSSQPQPPPGRAPTSQPSAASSRREMGRKTLFIGDSISANVDIESLENATQSKFVTAKTLFLNL